MRKLAVFLKPYAIFIAASLFFLVAQALAELNLPNLMAKMVDVGIKNGETPVIARLGATMLAVALVGGISSIMVSFFASRVAAGVTRDVRRAVFSSVIGFSSAETDSFSTASLITRTTNDVNQLLHLILMTLRMMCFAPVMGVGSLILAVRVCPSMSWILALAVGIVVAIIAGIFAVAMPKFRVVQKLVDRLNLVSREHLGGLMVIRAFGTEEFERGRFGKANADLTAVNLFVNRIITVMQPAMSFIMNGICLLIVWVGAREIAASRLLVGDMMAYIQYGMHVVMSFMIVSFLFIMIPRAAVSADRIAEVLGTEVSIANPARPESRDRSKRGLVEFRDVSFRYSGAEGDALRSISFTALPGQTTAFVGATGSGKSTLVNLIPRFYDATAGSVLVDGVDVRALSTGDLRSAIGFVPQKAGLMSGAVSTNLRYGNAGATDAEIGEAARVAQALDFIERLDGAFEAPVAGGGANLSGGQAQRLAIARALVKKPSIYIFDDSFSALDFKTDSALRKALRSYTSDATVLVVAQRIGTVMSADRIVVLDEGRVAGIGTHRELLDSCPLYREIAESQLTGEELA